MIGSRRSDPWASVWTTNQTSTPSPYRSMTEPLLDYIDRMEKEHPDDYITVVLPEFVVKHWWHHLLHNQSALTLKAALLFRPRVVTTSVPFHLKQ